MVIVIVVCRVIQGLHKENGNYGTVYMVVYISRNSPVIVV